MGSSAGTGSARHPERHPPPVMSTLKAGAPSGTLKK